MRLSRTHRVLLGTGAVVAWFGVLGFRFNLTPSLPVGIYRVTSALPVRGSIVHVCLPPDVAAFARERGYLGPGSCGTGVRPLGKQVLAVGGDVVTHQPDAIHVNGMRVPRSVTARRDSRGRPLPHHPWGEHHLQPGQLWLFSSYRANAYDSRYFGPIETQRVVSVLKPVWTWRGRSSSPKIGVGLAREPVPRLIKPTGEGGEDGGH